MDENCQGRAGRCHSPRACEEADTCLAARYLTVVKARPVVPEQKEMSFDKLGRFIYDHRPNGATGIYCTTHGVYYAFRTNPEKYPDNFISFTSLLGEKNGG